ncbi:hypothetical protein IPJ91_01705 [bacterium]|nr:MAG: hypothetical protein IPJ91_01705 [bacterium]
MLTLNRRKFTILLLVLFFVILIALFFVISNILQKQNVNPEKPSAAGPPGIEYIEGPVLTCKSDNGYTYGLRFNITEVTPAPKLNQLTTLGETWQSPNYAWEYTISLDQNITTDPLAKQRNNLQVRVYTWDHFCGGPSLTSPGYWLSDHSGGKSCDSVPNTYDWKNLGTKYYLSQNFQRNAEGKYCGSIQLDMKVTAIQDFNYEYNGNYGKVWDCTNLCESCGIQDPLPTGTTGRGRVAENFAGTGYTCNVSNPVTAASSAASIQPQSSARSSSVSSLPSTLLCGPKSDTVYYCGDTMPNSELCISGTPNVRGNLSLTYPETKWECSNGNESKKCAYSCIVKSSATSTLSSISSKQSSKTSTLSSISSRQSSNASPLSSALPTYPNLIIQKTADLSYVAGGTETNVAYILRVKNIGNGPTSGQMTVSDTLPTGMTLTVVSGVGVDNPTISSWSCNATNTQSFTCTRNVSIPAGRYAEDYIRVVAKVLSTASGELVNSARVSGGGERQVDDNDPEETGNNNTNMDNGDKWKITVGLASVNGSCGTANGTSDGICGSMPSGTLCATGNPSSSNIVLPQNGGSVIWTCNGLNGGSNSVACSASCVKENVISSAVNRSTTTTTGSTTLPNTATTNFIKYLGLVGMFVMLGSSLYILRNRATRTLTFEEIVEKNN